MPHRFSSMRVIALSTLQLKSAEASKVDWAKALVERKPIMVQAMMRLRRKRFFIHPNQEIFSKAGASCSPLTDRSEKASAILQSAACPFVVPAATVSG